MISIRNAAVEQLRHAWNMAMCEMPYAARHSVEAYQETRTDLDRIERQLLRLGARP